MSEVDNDLIEMTVKIGEKEKKWLVENPNVEIILRKIPFDKIPEKLEAYILMGDTVVNYAAIQTSEETIDKYFRPLLETITELPTTINQQLGLKLVELTAQIEVLKEVKDNLPENVKLQLGEPIGKLEACTTAISEFAGKISGSQKRGELGEDFIMDTLLKEFKEITFDLVNKAARSTDIKAKSPDMIECLVEVKNYTDPVPTKEVNKFWRDLDEQNVKIGCFLSLWTGIRNIGDCKIVTKGNKLGIFLNASHFSGSSGLNSGVELAFFIARQFARYFKKAEQERLEESILRQKIKGIQTEMEKMEEDLENFSKVEKIDKKLKKIKELAEECSSSIEKLLENLKAKITKIMTIEE
ncbi:MAG: hypothetical protein HWN65_07015 [Candidatus Helarchaeota archaeon]|nr:hypothetical protein [Candidatus Helarchaeota archaeon]